MRMRMPVRANRRWPPSQIGHVRSVGGLERPPLSRRSWVAVGYEKIPISEPKWASLESPRFLLQESVT
jgi:hypothetical protein